MTRLKYKTLFEGPSAGALESKNDITLADGRIVKIVIDPTNLQFGIIHVGTNVNHTDATQKLLIETGSGKHLTAVKRAVRASLVKLGAVLSTESRTSTNQVIAQATAVAAPIEAALENTGS